MLPETASSLYPSESAPSIGVPPPKGSRTAAMVGLVVGIVFAVFGLFGVGWFLLRRRQVYGERERSRSRTGSESKFRRWFVDTTIVQTNTNVRAGGSR
ncbi:hypothetical protein BU24DRAFT_419970 [Aaosphaeria arxii CBS 175.79]|uniref:PGF-CTERM archaeal protein-sorting signal domain-containing protein n=1 Tax=Aaosphaeria arxii CBS 175.79 TaxID=1450172 RepID=A0A6A5XW38_9PLEO|nr:uncharacterized protein BU24DRAFT_419970 [Aaosphaeria arxii CBS 175.79]KAF2016921.1 hypothetical protein BU24DRAFT_419970 [Aaosphaeria arxii CBS 175.79]